MRTTGLLAILFSAIILFACGGGGGGGTAASDATGQALAGAPMSSASITLKSLVDSTTGSTTAGVDGSFTLPKGVTPPALVTATSKNGAYTYYGYWKSSSQTTVAVNPITTTLLALAAGSNPSTISSSISDSALNTAKQSINTIFAQVFSATSVSSGIDFVSQTFTPNHTGLDLVLDSISATVKADGSVDLTNKFNGATTTVSANSVSALSFNAQAISSLSSAPIQQCSDLLGTLDSTKMATDQTVYDSSFLSYGKNRAQFMQYIANVSATTSFKLSMPVFAGVDGNGNYVFNALLVNSSSGDFISDISMATKLNGSSCVMVGDLFPFEITIQPAIKHHVRVDGTTSVNTTSSPVAGVEIQLGSNNVQNTYSGTTIQSARVDVCDANSNCTLLAKLTANNSGIGFTLDSSNYSGTSYSFMNMIPNPSFSLTSGVSNPIKVSFFSTAPAPTTGVVNLIGSPIYTRASADKFSTSEIAAITQPTIGNTSILTSSGSSPSFAYDSGSTVISSISVTTSISNQSPVSQEKLILTKGTGTVTLDQVNKTSSDYYRAIYVDGHIPGRNGMIETKYIWAPTCAGCF